MKIEVPTKTPRNTKKYLVVFVGNKSVTNKTTNGHTQEINDRVIRLWCGR
jgi:hypothetical protein